MLSLAELKSWGEITTTADDTTLLRLLGAAMDFAARHTGLSFQQTTYTDEIWDGNGTDTLVPHNAPLISLTSLTIDSDSITGSTGYDVNGWYLYPYVDPICVRLRGYTFSEGLGNVKLTYVAGSNLPKEDLQQAIFEIALTAYQKRQRLGQKSKQIGQETISFHDSEFTPGVMQVLNMHRRLCP